MIAIAMRALLFVPLAGFPDVSPGDACPGSESCCLAHNAPACNVTSCCEAVCGEDADCCGIEWSQSCVSLAHSMCGNLCAATVCPGSGDCCSEHEGPGCDVASCCASVCAADESCCTDSWDPTCVSQAESQCDSLCDLASGCPGQGNCCFRNGSPGCDDPACCSTVCTIDPYCCLGEWDDLCARKANQWCGGAGGAFCDWCPAEGSCCEGRGTPGCEKQACCELICAKSSRCCTEFWDSGCADFAATACVATACLCEFFGELDERPFVDLGDAALFFTCFTGGAGEPIVDECACADDDGDGDVDLGDYQNFAPFFVGE